MIEYVCAAPFLLPLFRKRGFGSVAPETSSSGSGGSGGKAGEEDPVDEIGDLLSIEYIQTRRLYRKDAPPLNDDDIIAIKSHNAGYSIVDLVETHQDLLQRYIIPPRWRPKVVWDLIIGVLIVGSLVQVGPSAFPRAACRGCQLCVCSGAFAITTHAWWTWRLRCVLG